MYSDWGGSYLTTMNVSASGNVLVEAMVLSGKDSPVVFLPGISTKLIRGSEVVILEPTKQEVIN